MGTAGKPAPHLPPRVATRLQQLAIEGELTRGTAIQHIEMSERTGRHILKELLAEGLVTSKSEKGMLRLHLY